MLSVDLSIQKLPPQNIDAEQGVLAAILLENQSLYSIMDILAVEDFYKESHRKIFSAMIELNRIGREIDLITISEHLRSRNQLEMMGGVAYLTDLMNSIATAASARSHANIVHEKAILRQLITASTEIVTRGYEAGEKVNDLLDYAEGVIFAISNNKIRTAFIPMKQLVKEGFAIIEKLADKKMTGLSTGFPDLDELTSGFQNSDLIIVAGRPAMGKTSFALEIAQNMAIKEKKACGIFSLEMSREQLVIRMLCSEARVDSNKIRQGYLGRQGGDTWNHLIDAAGRLHDAPIFIDDSASTSILEMRAKTRRLQMEHPLGMIVVDYLQLVRGRQDAESREKEIADISRSLKGLAKELGIPVVALSQLSRAVEAREKRRPILADLRESGAIEQDADLVLFIYRPEMYDPCKCMADLECSCGRRGIAEIIIGKQRNGPTGTVKLAFIDKYTRFESLAKNHPAHMAFN